MHPNQRWNTLPPLYAYLLSPLLVTATTLALFYLQAFLLVEDHIKTIRPFDIGYLVPLILITALGGRGPGIVTLALSALASVYVLSRPVFSWRLQHARDWTELILFLLIGALAVRAMDGLRASQQTLEDVSDTPPAHEIEASIRQVAGTIDGVRGLGRCVIKKRGLDYAVDVDVLVSGELPVRDGREIAHRVEEALCRSNPFILRARAHIEAQDNWAHHS